MKDLVPGSVNETSASEISSIFPFVIGGEVSYFSYSGSDNYLSQNYLTTFQTKIFSFGLNTEFSLSNIIKTDYTVPFITLDIKSNRIKRVISGYNPINVPGSESRISIGLGAGFTLFVMDIYVKYNYMKNLSSIGAFTKVRFKIFQF